MRIIRLALSISIPVNIHDVKTTANKATIKCIPKASTVYVPGAFKYICLVIVDVVEASFPTTEFFYIGNSHRATHAGNFDFGKIGHKIIGRNSEQPAKAATMVDCMAAWRVMCKGLLSHVNPGAIEVRLAILATSRFAGFSVWTDEAKPKKKVSEDDEYVSLLSDLGLEDAEVPSDLLGWMEKLDEVRKEDSIDSDDEVRDPEDLTGEHRASLVKAIIDLKYGRKVKDDKEVDHVSGVTCMDPKTDIKIGDHTVPDWFTSYNTTATMPDRVKYYTWWRVDPLHAFSQALISCTNGPSSRIKLQSTGQRKLPSPRIRGFGAKRN